MTSPVPDKKEEQPTDMSFTGAMMQIALGNKVARKEWENKDDHGLLKNDILTIHKDGKDHNWIVSLGDIENNDWYAL